MKQVPNEKPRHAEPSPYMTMAEAAEYLRYNGPRAADIARQFLQKAGVSLARRGRTYLVRQDSIDAYLETGLSDLDRAAQAAARRLTRGTRR